MAGGLDSQFMPSLHVCCLPLCRLGMEITFLITVHRFIR